MRDSINKIVSHLHRYLNIPVTPANQVHKKPSYPFITYDLITPVIEGNTFSNYEYSSTDETKTHKKVLEPEAVISFTAHHKNMFDALEVAEKAWEYLNHVGYDDLAMLNVVIVKTHNITDRTILDVDEYEYRYGFDVRIRYLKEIERTDATIKSWGVEYD